MARKSNRDRAVDVLESASSKNALAGLAIVEPCGDTWRVFVGGRLYGTHLMKDAAIDQALEVGSLAGCKSVTVLPFAATERRQVIPIQK